MWCRTTAAGWSSRRPRQPVRGSYVAGWIKRGPTGFIGTNKSCALQTVQNLVADYNAGLLADPSAKPGALDKLVRSRRPDMVDAAGWRAIDAAEIARGGEDRPRDKFTAVADMLAAAATRARAAAAAAGARRTAPLSEVLRRQQASAASSPLRFLPC